MVTKSIFRSSVTRFDQADERAGGQFCAKVGTGERVQALRAAVVVLDGEDLVVERRIDVVDVVDDVLGVRRESVGDVRELLVHDEVVEAQPFAALEQGLEGRCVGADVGQRVERVRRLHEVRAGRRGAVVVDACRNPELAVLDEQVHGEEAVREMLQSLPGRVRIQERGAEVAAVRVPAVRDGGRGVGSVGGDHAREIATRQAPLALPKGVPIRGGGDLGCARMREVVVEQQVFDGARSRAG